MDRQCPPRGAFCRTSSLKAQRAKKGATPSEVVFEEDRVKLLHYPGDGNIKHRTPLIFVFALVNRPYILDILPNKSVVSHFVKAGFDTYLIDWGVATDADRHLTLDDYINSYLRNVVVKHVRMPAAVPAQVSLLSCTVIDGYDNRDVHRIASEIRVKNFPEAHGGRHRLLHLAAAF